MRKLTGILLFFCLFGFLSGADQPDFPDIYIDEGCAGTHVGSLVNPYDDIADINWTTGGDNSIFDYLAGAPSQSPKIYHNKGDTWRETLTIGCSGTATYRIIVQAYGSGADPVIKGSDLITPGANWTNDAGNVWYATVSINPRSAIYMDGTWGDKKTVKGDLVNEYDWYWDDGEDRLYVYSTTDPDTAYTSPGVEHGVRSYVININGKDYITLDSLAPKHGTYDSIRENTGCNYLTIQNLTLTHSGQSATFIVAPANIHVDNVIAIYNWNCGIKVDGATSGTIENCDSHHNGVGGTTSSHALHLEDSSGLTVQYNKFHDAFSSDGGSGIGGDRFFSNIIQYNEFYGQLPYSGIDLTAHVAGDCYSNIIRYNLFYNISGKNMAAGVFLWTESGAGADCYSNEIYYNVFYGNNNGITMDERSHDNLIYNNVIYNNGVGSRRGIYIYTSNVTPVDNLIKNNIVYSTAGGVHAGTDNTEASNIFDNNCYYPDQAGCFRWNDVAKNTFADWKTASSQDGNSINSDPAFVTLGSDFHLQSGSPCIETGTDVSLTQDYDGISVPQGNYPEMGAYEYPANILRIREVLRIRNVLRIK